MNYPRIDLATLAARTLDLKLAWERSLAEKEATTRYASLHKVDPGKDYWLPEHKARLKYQTAWALLCALKDATDGK